MKQIILNYLFRLFFNKNRVVISEQLEKLRILRNRFTPTGSITVGINAWYFATAPNDQDNIYSLSIHSDKGLIQFHGNDLDLLFHQMEFELDNRYNVKSTESELVL